MPGMARERRAIALTAPPLSDQNSFFFQDERQRVDVFCIDTPRSTFPISGASVVSCVLFNWVAR